MLATMKVLLLKTCSMIITAAWLSLQHDYHCSMIITSAWLSLQHDYHCSTDGVHCAEILRSVTFPLYNNRCTMFLLLSITKMRIDHLICVFSVGKDDFWWRGKTEEQTQCIASFTWVSLKSPSLELPCKYWKYFPSPPPRWNRWVRDRYFAW